ncbi:MAG: D-glycerate dehydrogenase [Synergistetes bacterium]|nr:D-glycerate dehydrogenase [Synergistota bacterium]
MRKIFVVRRLLDVVLSELRSLGEVEVYNKEDVIPKEELMERVRDVDAVVPLPGVDIDRDVISCMRKCIIIANYAVGYNNIDIDAASDRGILVTNTPDVLTEATADLAWALMLAVARRIVEGDRFVREGRFKGMDPLLLLGEDIYGKTLGVVGAGRIGTAVARRGVGFDMRLLYYSRHRHDKIERVGAEYVDLSTLLKESDFVSLNVPYTKETHHLINAKALALMKSNAILVNTARGPVVDEKALVDALKSGVIRGAGLDVYEREPEVTPELMSLQRVVLTPHMGSASYRARLKMGKLVVKNIRAAFDGEVPPNLLNGSRIRKSH